MTKKVTIVLVAVIVLLAGCSGGGTMSTSEAVTENATENGTSMGSNQTESTSDDSTLLSAVSTDSLANGTVINGTWYNGTQQTSGLIRNETESPRKLIKFTHQSGNTTSVYSTADYIAAYSSTTGNVRYGGPNSLVGDRPTFAATSAAYAAFFYSQIVEWEQTETMTVDGQEVLVFESNSLNESVFNEKQGQSLYFKMEQNEIQSVDGRAVISSAGKIQSINVEIETPDGTVGGDVSVSYEDITVTKPSWVNQSQAS